MGTKATSITLALLSCSQLVAGEVDDSPYTRHALSTCHKTTLGNTATFEEKVKAAARKLEAAGNPAFMKLYEVIKDPETSEDKIRKIVSKNKNNPYWDVLNESAEEFIKEQKKRGKIKDVHDFTQDKLAGVEHLLNLYDRIRKEDTALSIHCLRPEYMLRTGTLTMTDHDTGKEIKPTRDSFKVSIGSHTGISTETIKTELNARYAFLIKRHAERNQQDLASVSKLTINLSDLHRADYIPWHIEAICEQNLFPNLKRIALITDCLFDHQGERAAKEYLRKKKFGGISPTLTNRFSCSNLLIEAVSWCVRKSVDRHLSAIRKRLPF
ncbi:MAG: hypothetical protein NT128_00120 [Proteobacteria bacterium]|nr:hypothetical protein [Pseudomonadota bacterium]